MDLARKLIIEWQGREMIVTLQRGLSAHEVWNVFAKRGHRPTAVYLAKGTARVSFA